jgi:hypothetical protein
MNCFICALLSTRVGSLAGMKSSYRLANNDHLLKAGWSANSVYDNVQAAWLRGTLSAPARVTRATPLAAKEEDRSDIGCCFSTCFAKYHRCSQRSTFCRMSVEGHSRRSDRAAITSGIPLSADILSARRHVSKVPTADSCGAANSVTFDHVAPSRGYPIGESLDK